MIKKFVFSILFISILLGLTACSQDPNHVFIQGQWIFDNEGGAERSGAAHVYYEWRFDNGRFSSYQEIINGIPDTLEGYYRIQSSDEDSIELELYDVIGPRASQYANRMLHITIQIDRENERIIINRARFYRGYQSSDS